VRGTPVSGASSNIVRLGPSIWPFTGEYVFCAAQHAGISAAAAKTTAENFLALRHMLSHLDFSDRADFAASHGFAAGKCGRYCPY
jgi:hypothetical protein